jgi:RHS repeat-associated protein
VRAESVTVTLVYTYNASGLRMAQSVDGDETAFAWDVALGLAQVLATSDGTLDLYGLGRIAEVRGGEWAYVLPDGLGSVRQWADDAGDVTYAGGYTPYGVELWQAGSTKSAWWFTGEWWDADLGLEYLRARWYSPQVGIFSSPDPFPGLREQPLSLHTYLYVLANPTNLVDPSGYTWDDTQKENLSRMKQAFLDSAGRHNQIPTMDNNGFAALIAAVIVSEGHLDADPYTGDDQYWAVENAAIAVGCIVSGHFLEQACKNEPDREKCLAYLFNELPEGHPLGTLASVGIGNVKLYTAANLWRGRACRVFLKGGVLVEECTPVEVSPLQQTKRFLSREWEKDIPNPFGEVCEDGICESYDPAEATGAYQTMAKQLLYVKTNIEYVAANLEAGALRALSLGLTPSAFNSASWHMRGLQTNREIKDARWHPGGAMYIVNDIPIALNIWGLTSRWSLSESTEPQYYYWKSVYE